VWAEQAVFTSLLRRGRGGYHLVSRSKGVHAADAQSLARWAPSHGALMGPASIFIRYRAVGLPFHARVRGRPNIVAEEDVSSTLIS
jgi:hypothetical protein